MMKVLKSWSALGVLVLALFVMSCGGSHSHGEDGHDQGEETMEMDKSGKEYTSEYICPMHCEGSGSEEAGTCPVCGMDYVMNKDADHSGHDHDGHDHDGHNH